MQIKNLLFKDFIRLVYKVLIIVLRKIQSRFPPTVACFFQNVLMFLVQSKVRFNFDKTSKLFCVKEEKVLRYFGDMSRGFDIYGRSLTARGKNLAASYCLSHIRFNQDDIVIDCGANYGDLYLYLDGKINKKNYITFEPGPIEHSCIKKSLPEAKCFNLGLSNEIGVKEFYLCSSLGDSSFEKPNFFTEIVNVEVTTLNHFFFNNRIKNCKLIKLEAEGCELEILHGAQKILKFCQYVAIDGGRERGINSELTFHKLNNFLLNNKFEMIDIFGPAYRALYKNSKIIDLDKLN
jgi:FkbM family methyltransferase